ncbi:MAG: hypothetical protein ABMA13_12410 [Chthoniobacteraceae bacterium]
MNEDPFAELAAALRERVEVIADRDLYARAPEEHLEKLKAASSRIELAGAALPKPVPGDLAHFLKGSSFQKALAWIEARGR